MNDNSQSNTPKHSHTGQLLINLLLLAGLAAIFILFFSKSNSTETTEDAFNQASGEGLRVAFLNKDSITSNYELAKIATQELEAQGKKLEDDIKARMQQLETQAQTLQNNIETRRYPEAQLNSAAQLLQQKERELYELRQVYTEQLAEAEAIKYQVYLDSLNNFLDRYKLANDIDFIFNSSEGSSLMSAGDVFEITEQVLNGLNEEWFKVNPSDTE